MRAGTGSFETEPPSEAEMAARLARVTGKVHPHLVAVVDGEVAGFAYATSFREREAFAATLEDSVYVRFDRRGQGIGRALLEALITEAQVRGYRQMLALIGDSTNAGSVALHAATGFAHVGVMRAVGWKFGRWLDVVVMQRALGAGDGMPPGVMFSQV